MARKPNYRFERMERDRQKAAKKAARAKAKAEKAELKNAGPDGVPPEGEEFPGTAPTEVRVEGSLDGPAVATPAED